MADNKKIKTGPSTPNQGRQGIMRGLTTLSDNFANPNMNYDVTTRLAGAALSGLERTIMQGTLGRAISWKMRGDKQAFKRVIGGQILQATVGRMGSVGQALAASIAKANDMVDDNPAIEEINRIKRKTRGGAEVSNDDLFAGLEKTAKNIDERFGYIVGGFEEIADTAERMDQRLKKVEDVNKENLKMLADEMFKKLEQTSKPIVDKLINTEKAILDITTGLQQHDKQIKSINSTIRVLAKRMTQEGGSKTQGSGIDLSGLPPTERKIIANFLKTAVMGRGAVGRTGMLATGARYGAGAAMGVGAVSAVAKGGGIAAALAALPAAIATIMNIPSDYFGGEGSAADKLYKYSQDLAKKKKPIQDIYKHSQTPMPKGNRTRREDMRRKGMSKKQIEDIAGPGVGKGKNAPNWASENLPDWMLGPHAAPKKNAPPQKPRSQLEKEVERDLSAPLGSRNIKGGPIERLQNRNRSTEIITMPDGSKRVLDPKNPADKKIIDKGKSDLRKMMKGASLSGSSGTGSLMGSGREDQLQNYSNKTIPYKEVPGMSSAIAGQIHGRRSADPRVKAPVRTGRVHDSTVFGKGLPLAIEGGPYMERGRFGYGTLQKPFAGGGHSQYSEASGGGDYYSSRGYDAGPSGPAWTGFKDGGPRNDTAPKGAARHGLPPDVARALGVPAGSGGTGGQSPRKGKASSTWGNNITQGGRGLVGGAGIPKKYRDNPEVMAAINQVAKRQGIDPQAVAQVIKLESGWDPRNATGSYRGLTQIGPDTFKDTAIRRNGGRLGGLTWSEYKKASPADQIKVYGAWLEHYDFKGKNEKVGLNITKMNPAQQAAALQAAQFAPNAMAWRKAAARDNLNVRATKSKQARVLGDTSIGDMSRYYTRQMNKNPAQYAEMPSKEQSLGSGFAGLRGSSGTQSGAEGANRLEGATSPPQTKGLMGAGAGLTGAGMGAKTKQLPKGDFGPMKSVGPKNYTLPLLSSTMAVKGKGGWHGRSSEFGHTRGKGGGYRHGGIDLYAVDPKTGKLRVGTAAPVFVPQDGKITSIRKHRGGTRRGQKSGAGHYIIIKDKHGISHRFLHTSLETLNNPRTGKPWKNGDKVKAGDHLTNVTGSGTAFGRKASELGSVNAAVAYYDKRGWGNTNMPHLHYEMSYKGRKIDPDDVFTEMEAGIYKGVTDKKKKVIGWTADDLEKINASLGEGGRTPTPAAQSKIGQIAASAAALQAEASDVGTGVKASDKAGISKFSPSDKQAAPPVAQRGLTSYAGLKSDDKSGASNAKPSDASKAIKPSTLSGLAKAADKTKAATVSEAKPTEIKAATAAKTIQARELTPKQKAGMKSFALEGSSGASTLKGSTMPSLPEQNPISTDKAGAKPKSVPAPAAKPKPVPAPVAAKKPAATPTKPAGGTLGITDKKRLDANAAAKKSAEASAVSSRLGVSKKRLDANKLKRDEVSSSRLGLPASKLAKNPGLPKKDQKDGSMGSEENTTGGGSNNPGESGERYSGGKEMPTPTGYNPESEEASPGNNGYGTYMNCFI